MIQSPTHLSFISTLQGGWKTFVASRRFIIILWLILIVFHAVSEVYLGWRAGLAVTKTSLNGIQLTEIKEIFMGWVTWEWFLIRFFEWFLLIFCLVKWFYWSEKISASLMLSILLTFKCLLGGFVLAASSLIGAAFPLLIFVAGLFAPIWMELCFGGGRLWSSLKNCLTLNYGGVKTSSTGDGIQRALLVLSVWACGYILIHWLSIMSSFMVSKLEFLEVQITEYNPVTWAYLSHELLSWAFLVLGIFFVNHCYYFFIKSLRILKIYYDEISIVDNHEV